MPAPGARPGCGPRPCPGAAMRPPRQHWEKGPAMTAPTQEHTAPRTLAEPIEVRFTPAGVPLAVRWRGRLWPVAAEPLHWFDRVNWWETTLPAGPGQGNIVQTEHWRIQVRATSTSPLRTLDLCRHPGRDRWELAAVSDI